MNQRDQSSQANSLGILALDTSLAMIRATGADTESFLQGQLSNDVRKLVDEQGQLSSYNSPKGRMLAVLSLTRSGADIDLELPRSLLEPVMRRLRMFVMRSKVTLGESPDAVLGLRGLPAAGALESAGLPAPEAPLGCAHADGFRVVRRHGAVPRFSVHGPRDRLDELAARWPEALHLDADTWALDELRAGLPVVLPSTQDRFVAQMANLDQLKGISFDKGCYTGQEIVARLHYLGQLKRRMFWSSGRGAAPEPGSPVHDGDGEQAVGEVVNAIAVDEGFEATLVLQLAHAESTQLRVGGAPLTMPRAFAYSPQVGLS